MVSKIFNGDKKSKEDENVSSITPAQLGDMRGVIPPDYGVQEATGTTLERNPDISRRLVVHYDSVWMGCRFPLHPLLIELCNRYAIPPGQISSNSHESLFGFLARCHKRSIQPTLELFLSFFRPHNPIDKLDDWFRRFFVVVVPEDLPFPNVWRKKEDKFPSHTFPTRDSELDRIYRLLLKNGYSVPRALLFKDSHFRGLGYWVSPKIPSQEPSGNTTSSWVPPFRRTRLRRQSSRRDPSLEEDIDGEEAGSVTGTQPMLLADRPRLSEEVVVEDASDDDGLYDFPPGTLRGSGLIPGVPHIPLFGRGTSPSAQFMGPLGFHPHPSGTMPIGRTTGSQGSLEPPHVQPEPSTALNFAESAAESIFGMPLGQGGVPLPGANIHRSFRETEELIRSSSFGKAIVPSSARPTVVPGPSTQETGSSSSSSQAHHKRGRNSTPLPGSLVSASPSMGTADHFFGTAGDGSPTGQGSQPFPYAREAYQYTGYTAWVGRDFNSKLEAIQQLKRDHPDVIHSPVWPFMQEEYTRMADYVATSSAQRHSLRLLDRNAALSKELRDFKSRHSICVERPEYGQIMDRKLPFLSFLQRTAPFNKKREKENTLK
ncbi:unnamed protein product [Cuscuta campestris]|uniref:Uncharacterized protein n=1 Tax=Cuscuta campestris TaxID=132261 RepID=A0A484K2J2_9ASTE|nr:unnamed protein product [Cuscuta campestris]